MTWLKLKSAWNNEPAGKIIAVEDDVKAKSLIEIGAAETSEDPTKSTADDLSKKFDEKLKSFGESAAQKAIEKFAATTKGGKRPVVGDLQAHDNELDDPKLGFKSGLDFWHTFATAQRGKNMAEQASAKARLFGDDGYVKKLEARTKAIPGQFEGTDSEGGIFVVPEFSTELMTTEAQLAKLRPYCRTFAMSGTSYTIRARVDKNHQNSVAGGITVSRVAEGIPTNKSKAQFEGIRLTPTKQTGYCSITDEMMEDAPAFASLFPGFFGEAMAGAEENDILYGDGSGAPLGAFNANNPSLYVTPKTTGQTAATLTITNVLTMRSVCYGYSTAAWVASQDIIPQLATFVIGTMPVFLPSAKSDLPDTLLGRPILWSEYCPTIGTQNDIVLFNGREYGIGDRGGLNSAQSMHVKFLEGEQVIKFWRRNDGQPLWRSPLTTVKGSTRSPFVTLATRS